MNSANFQLSTLNFQLTFFVPLRFFLSSWQKKALRAHINNWINIISFTYPHEAHLAKGRLESEGIEVIIKDELTVQVINLYSNAVGGVNLLVKDSDFEEARQILIEAGYKKKMNLQQMSFGSGSTNTQQNCR